MSTTTTVQVSTKLKKDLDGFKEYERETYAEVIRKLVEKAKENEESEFELSEETLKGVIEAKEDIRKGRLYTTKQLKKELDLK